MKFVHGLKSDWRKEKHNINLNWKAQIPSLLIASLFLLCSRIFFLGTMA